MRFTRAQITPVLLQQLLDYDPLTGVLTWKPRSVSLFADDTMMTARQRADGWNAKYAGKPALHAQDGRGYRHGTVFSITFAAARVAWAIHHGVWPVNDLDHEDHDRANDRISNLRDITHGGNMKNIAYRQRMKPLPMGVHYATNGKYVARCRISGTMTHIGVYLTVKEAETAVRTARAGNGYHANHGK